VRRLVARAGVPAAAGILRHAGLEQLRTRFAASSCTASPKPSKLALADRLAWYGRPGASSTCRSALLSDAYGRERWARIGARAADRARSGQPGRLASAAPAGPGRRARTLAESDVRFGIGEPTFADLPPVAEWAEREVFVGDTCHIDVSTPTATWCRPRPRGAGCRPAHHPGARLLAQHAPADDLAGRRRAQHRAARQAALHHLSPSMALRDGEPYLAFGIARGRPAGPVVVAFLLRHAVHGMNLQQAIDAPAWHVDHFPASFWPHATRLNRLSVESRLPEATVAALREAGHEVVVGPAWSEGRITACSRERDEAGRLVLRAAANPRGMQGYAVGR
jgi:gamma-glutamyltranspeptidase/glutathione hydrolase